MKVLKSLGTAAVAALKQPYIWLWQFVGNAVLIFCFILWLDIPVANWWEVAFNFLLAVAVAGGALLLQGGTMNYFSDILEDPSSRLKPAFMSALKHMLALALWAAVFAGLEYLVLLLNNYQYSLPGWMRSEMPAWMRRHISEAALDRLYDWFVGFLKWVVVPGLLLPLGALCADIGFRGFILLRGWWSMVRRLTWWIGLVVAGLLGVLCVKAIMAWTITSSVGAEKTWLTVRLLVSYLLAIYSWLLVCALLARGRVQPEREAESQKAAA